MSQISDSPLPCIFISFAPNEPLALLESSSSFALGHPAEPDSPRPQHLLPPPTMSPNQLLHPQRQTQLSPLSPPLPNGGKGLERARFEAMLRASKERSAKVGAKKPVELRKEIAVKVQKAKQLERRARFLSKLAAPPSPSAADLPVTPPDSPAIFHFTLPSPGLESPLEHFENLLDHPEIFELTKRVEQVDFRLPRQKQPDITHRHHFVPLASNGASLIPSLDQISQRLNKGPGSIRTTRSSSPDKESKGNNRLPSFLRSRSPPSGAATEAMPPCNDQSPKPSRPVLPILSLGVAMSPEGVAVRTPTPIAKVPPFYELPPSPKSPHRVKLQVTTTLCPPTMSNSSPTEFNEKNIAQLGSGKMGAVARRLTVSTVTDVPNVPSRRAQATRDMFHKLSRRTSVLPGAAACGIKARDDISLTVSPSDSEDKVRRRISAPAEMPAAQRGAHHPVLEKPGGF